MQDPGLGMLILSLLLQGSQPPYGSGSPADPQVTEEETEAQSGPLTKATVLIHGNVKAEPESVGLGAPFTWDSRPAGWRGRGFPHMLEPRPLPLTLLSSVPCLAALRLVPKLEGGPSHPRGREPPPQKPLILHLVRDRKWDSPFSGAGSWGNPVKAI